MNYLKIACFIILALVIVAGKLVYNDYNENQDQRYNAEHFIKFSDKVKITNVHYTNFARVVTFKGNFEEYYDVVESLRPYRQVPMPGQIWSLKVTTDGKSVTFDKLITYCDWSGCKKDAVWFSGKNYCDEHKKETSG